MQSEKDFNLAKRDIFRPRFQQEYLNTTFLSNAEWHRSEYLRYLRLAEVFCDIYLPDSHPLVGTKLLQPNRTLEVTDLGHAKKYRSIHHLLNFERIGKRDMEIIFAEEPHVLEHIDYKGEPYWKLSTLFEREQPIPKFNVVQVTHPVYSQPKDE